MGDLVWDADRDWSDNWFPTLEFEYEHIKRKVPTWMRDSSRVKLELYLLKEEIADKHRSLWRRQWLDRDKDFLFPFPDLEKSESESDSEYERGRGGGKEEEEEEEDRTTRGRSFFKDTKSLRKKKRAHSAEGRSRSSSRDPPSPNTCETPKPFNLPSVAQTSVAFSEFEHVIVFGRADPDNVTASTFELGALKLDSMKEGAVEKHLEALLDAHNYPGAKLVRAVASSGGNLWFSGSAVLWAYLKETTGKSPDWYPNDVDIWVSADVESSLFGSEAFRDFTRIRQDASDYGLDTLCCFTHLVDKDSDSDNDLTLQTIHSPRNTPEKVIRRFDMDVVRMYSNGTTTFVCAIAREAIAQNKASLQHLVHLPNVECYTDLHVKRCVKYESRGFEAYPHVMLSPYYFESDLKREDYYLTDAGYQARARLESVLRFKKVNIPGYKRVFVFDDTDERGWRFAYMFERERGRLTKAARAQ